MARRFLEIRVCLSFCLFLYPSFCPSFCWSCLSFCLFRSLGSLGIYTLVFSYIYHGIMSPYGIVHEFFKEKSALGKND